MTKNITLKSVFCENIPTPGAEKNRKMEEKRGRGGQEL
jgi:hypothetical protein